MNKMVLFILLALSSAPALSSDNSQIGKVTRLMTKDLPDLPGKEGMVETVDFAPGEVSQPHRHNADLFVYVLEGSIITQVKGGSPQTVHAGEVFYESPTDVHIVSRNASEAQPAKLLVFYVKAKGTPPTVLFGGGGKELAVGRIAVTLSVDNDDNARWLTQRLHRLFGSSIDVNPRFLGWLPLVIRSRPVELSIAQHNTALGENGTLQFCDSLGIGPIR